jgi:hypothetical protein
MAGPATAHVTSVEPTNMPAVLYFKVDTARGSCAAGQTVSWAIRGADAAAQAANANRTVEIYGLNADCSRQLYPYPVMGLSDVCN